ncbi:MAG TPA: hypothetical protein VFM72_08980 [Aequorivita sp.]|nr:hypothetical protein [Aequorivita sp.]
MKILTKILMVVFVAALISCAAEDQTIKDTIENNQTFQKIVQTPEMINFKNALSELTRAKISEQIENGQASSLFKTKNKEIINAPAKALLVSSGYKDADLEKLDNRSIFQLALKVYARKTQLQPVK